MKINIVSEQLIKPSIPTPSHLRDYKLSFIDEVIPHSYIPLILYYSPSKSSNVKQSELSERIRISLSDTLTQFYPLAGRTEGQTSIDCNDEGVYYSEAQVDAQLADLIESPEVKILDQLLPCKSIGSISNAKELLAIQISFFNCGGIAIGICQSHRIGDGCTLCTFIKGWAATACGANDTVCPIFNVASVFPPRDTSDFRPNIRAPALQLSVEKLVTRRFVFTPTEVDLLKTKAFNRYPNLKPSRVEAVSAVIWQCWMAAKGLERSDVSVAFHPVNLRERIIPSLLEFSFGNIFQMVNAVTSVETDWISLVEKLRNAKGKIDHEYGKKLLGENGFKVAKSNFAEIGRQLSGGNAHVIRFSSWCGFPLYKADFGWGNPIWVSSSSFCSKNHVFLLDSSSPGGIEAWIAMADDEMAKLEQDLKLPAIT